MSVSWLRKLYIYLIITFRTSCVVIHVAISINRYHTIVNPLKYSAIFTPSFAYRISCIIIFMMLLLWLPLNIGFHFFSHANHLHARYALMTIMLSEKCSLVFGTKFYRFEPTNTICAKYIWRGMLFFGFVSVIIMFMINMVVLAKLKKSNKVSRNF